jgi:hypothetical protein
MDTKNGKENEVRLVECPDLDEEEFGPISLLKVGINIILIPTPKQT